MSEALIQLTGVNKNYPVLQQGSHKLAHVWARLTNGDPRHVYRALSDVSFQVNKGESLGIVGVNGAGKSTLLKLIAGVVTPTSGQIGRKGRIGALLELGAGFHPEYSGRENVFLSCALMGLTRADTLDRMDRILAFADIGEHIDQPIKHYSSGMVVRLGFAVATSVVPDVLITDEVLAVGDESFQKKCILWLEDYLANNGTLLLCSHSMYHIQKLCKRAVWIDHGRIFMEGSAADVTRAYLAWHEEKTRVHKELAKGIHQTHTLNVQGAEVAGVKGRAANDVAITAASDNFAGIYEVKEMYLNGQNVGVSLCLQMGQDLIVSGKVHSPDGRAPNVAVGFVRADGTPIYGIVSEMDAYTLQRTNGTLFEYAIKFSKLPLLPGRYIARSHAMDPEGLRLFDQVEMPFDISGSSRELGYCRLEHQWLGGDRA